MRLELKDITKHFPGVLANDKISISADKGEVLGLLGENGAGKTTLMSIMFGFIPLTSGEISIGGEPVDFESPRDALDRGIGMVHQHFMLVPNFTVAENVVLGTEAPTRLRFDPRALEAEVRQAAHEHSMGVAAEHRIADLPIDARQRVEILKLLYRGATTLILDEPTSALGVKQSAIVLRHIVAARNRGLGVIFITHNVSHALPIGDTFTILSRGRTGGQFSRGEVDADQLHSQMGGGDELHELTRELEALAKSERKSTVAEPPVSH
jgi:simple sugar transport system ATP-binding protein